MHLSPDEVIFFHYGFAKLNLTIVTTWGLMLLMTVSSWLITRKLKDDLHISRWQHVLEVITLAIKTQIEQVGLMASRKYLGFIGTLFLFILMSNLCVIFPGYEPPTGSLSTTAALALCVFVAVPLFGVKELGITGYLKFYMRPTIIMLPFNVISEISRTFALAIRLFGNVMSGGMVLAILLSITPLIFPLLLDALHLLTGIVQAYIFSVLATVYIAAATRRAGE